ncbi:MAG: tyrosine-type recombinase/integrase [Treponema sp.]|jgi:integrase|nr:tyrosine-type recombinase/integrase [Treponema sp.]
MEITGDLLTISDVAAILSVDEGTVQTLADFGALHGTSVQGTRGLMFNQRAVASWLASNPTANNMADKEYLKKLRAYYLKEFPQAMAEIRKFDAQFSFHKPKLYCLHKVANKKYGFLWYVRFMENGKPIRSRWCTHTNNRDAAEQWAVSNRDRLLREYYERKKNRAEFLSVLEQYYAPGSSYLATDALRGIVLSEKTRSVYHHFMKKVLVKFFKGQKVKKFDDVTPPVIAALQNHLLEKGNKPQTINRYLGVLRTIINHLIMDGAITSNVFDNIIMLKERAADSKARGCYNIDRIRGVFNKRWKNKTSYTLCLVIYSTGLRNSEIEKIKFGDIIKIGGCYFVDVTKSKTESGVRIVPLHDFTYQKIVSFMKSAGKKQEDYLFSARGGPNQSKVYKKAAADMADILGADEGERKDISFYSGRHYWKTLMNAGNLGDVEEYFMGHKVSKDVAKRYNHLDRQGKEHIVEKAREVFGILDKRLFQ